MTILVTGASHGIGLFLCKEFAAQGHSIYGTYHKTLPTTDVPVTYTQVDISNEDSVISWIKSIDFKDSEKIVLLNCAGINYNSQIHKSDTPMWKAVIEVNLLGVYYTMKHIVPIMRSMKGGRIVNFASIVPKIGVPGTSAYSASKAALWGLSRAVAVENAKYGITINTINLGYFDVGMIEQVPETVLDNIRSRIPIGELGKPKELQKLVDYLMSADYITGSSIDLTGGL